MKNFRVAVLRGGPGGEYDVSLETGAHVLKHLPGEKYAGVDVLIDRRGAWHVAGAPVAPGELLNHADVAFNAVHGACGGDGQAQQILESVGMPYTGSGVAASALGMHKSLAKEKFREHGMQTPEHRELDLEADGHDIIRDIFRSLPPPLVVKPAIGGASLSIGIVHDYQGLHEAIARAAEMSPRIVVERFVKGREAACGVVENFRGQAHYALPPVEAEGPRCPGRFSAEERHELQNLAIRAHRAIGARHYSHSDFIVTPRGIYILEINTLPGLTPGSLFPLSLEAAGIGFGEFLDHVLQQT